MEKRGFKVSIENTPPPRHRPIKPAHPSPVNPVSHAARKMPMPSRAPMPARPS
jgi:hypothetical protein